MGRIADAVSVLFPKRATRYLLNRRTYKQAKRLYDAATASQWRPTVENSASGNASMSTAGTKLRQLARHMEENHDLVVSVFDDLVNNTVGTGVALAPMVRTPTGELHDEFNSRIVEAWDDWKDTPETTGELGFE